MDMKLGLILQKPKKCKTYNKQLTQYFAALKKLEIGISGLRKSG